MFDGLKAAVMRFVGRPILRWLGSSAPGGAFLFNAEKVGDPRANSAVEAVVGWIARNFAEAPVEVRQVKGEEITPIPLHPMVRLLEKPNPFYSGQLLMQMAMLSRLTTGNGYLRKIRNANDVPVELWWIPNPWLRPQWPKDGTEYLSHYDYKPDANRPAERVEVRDIIHFREGIDPDNYRLGRSRLYSLLREVYTDNEASLYTAAILHNLGVPGLIIAPTQPDTDVNGEEVSRIADERFTGENRGSTMTLTAPATVTMIGFNPQQMDLRNLRRIPEERISGVYGVAAIVAGLGAGLDRSTFANFKEARSAAYEECCISMQREVSAELEVQLLPDFHDERALQSLDVAFDISQVRVLAEDADALVKRVDAAVKGGWLSVAAGKRLVGWQIEAGDEVYLRSWNTVATPVGQTTTQPTVTARAFTPTGVGLNSAPWLPVSGLKSTDSLRARLERIVGKRLAEEMAAYFRTLAAKITPETKAGWDASIDWSQEQEAIRSILIQVYGQVGEEVYTQFAAETGIDLKASTIRVDPEAIGQRVTGITEETRSVLAEAVTTAQEKGYTQAQLLEGVPEDGFRGLKETFSAWSDTRAEMIARTELANAYNISSTSAYRDSGVVQFVTVFDGDLDPECADANGATWPLDRADREPLGHPNCQRSFSPIFPTAPGTASLSHRNGKSVTLPEPEGWTLLPPTVNPTPVTVQPTEVTIDTQPIVDVVESGQRALEDVLEEVVRVGNRPRRFTISRDSNGLMTRVEEE